MSSPNRQPYGPLWRWVCPFWLTWLFGRLPASIRFHPFALSVRQGSPGPVEKKPSDILLLLLRVILFLALSALLADPYWMPESSPEKKAESGKETLLAIGVSPSMAGWGGLEEARNLALSLIDEEEGELGLVVFGQNILAEWKPGTGKNELTDVVGA